jgi:hypothetical protein
VSQRDRNHDFLQDLLIEFVVGGVDSLRVGPPLSRPATFRRRKHFMTFTDMLRCAA